MNVEDINLEHNADFISWIDAKITQSPKIVLKNLLWNNVKEKIVP